MAKKNIEESLVIEEPQVKKVSCEFTLDDQGNPLIICPDVDSQEKAFQATAKHPDLSFRVAPKLVVEEINPCAVD